MARPLKGSPDSKRGATFRAAGLALVAVSGLSVATFPVWDQWFGPDSVIGFVLTLTWTLCWIPGIVCYYIGWRRKISAPRTW
jgi:hypothetical protein